MPQFGAHFSTAGGVTKAIDLATRFGADACQIFTKNANQWAGKPLLADDCDAFRAAVERAGIRHPTAHDSYLINLASPDAALYAKSVAAFAEEIRRADLLGLSYLVSHPGAHVGTGEEAGLARVVAGYDEALAQVPDSRVTLLIEVTAGQGSCLGAKFEHLAYILQNIKYPERYGVCFDTCHAFAAGYDLRGESGYAQVMAEFDAVVGLRQIKLFHVNDSQKGLGSRVDRHAGLGLGEIGLDCFRALATDARFAELPMVLETPKEDDEGREMDGVNLGILRGFGAGLSGLTAIAPAAHNRR